MSILSKRALVIEDVADQRMLLRKMLEKAGMTVIEAESMDQAFIQLSQALPDLILLDLQMPGRSGFSLLGNRAVLPGLNSVPIIVTSGLNDKDSVHRAISLGASDYLIKPFITSKLLQKVHKHLKDDGFLSHRFPAGSAPQTHLLIDAVISCLEKASFLLDAPVKIAPQSEIRFQFPAGEEIGLDPSAFCISDSRPAVRSISGHYRKRIQVAGLTKAMRPDPSKGRAHESPAAHKSVVFVVDDDPAFNQLMEQILKKHGLNAESFLDLETAQARLSRQLPSLCLIDLNLGAPQKGLELIQKIRSAYSQTLPIFVVSTVSDRSAIAHAIEAGADDYLIKPLDQDVLAAKLSSYLSPPELKSPVMSSASTEKPVKTKAELDVRLDYLDELCITIESEHMIPKGSVLSVGGPAVKELTGEEQAFGVTTVSSAVEVGKETFTTTLEFDATRGAVADRIRAWLIKQRETKPASP